MRQKLIITVIGLLIVLQSSIMITDADTTLSPKTYVVDILGNGNFTTITDALDVAEDGDTILIYDGHYYESVTVNKEISLIGNGTGSTFIHGLSASQYVLGAYTGVTKIQGITVIANQNVSQTCYSGPSRYRTNVENCKFIGGRNGISLSGKNEIFSNIEIINCIFPIRVNRDADNNQFNNVIITCQWEDDPEMIIDTNLVRFRDCNLYNCSFPRNSIEMDIDSSNYVNGKPYRCYKYQNSISVPSFTGQLVMKKCDDARISNLNMSHQKSAIYLQNSNVFEIKNCYFNNIFDTSIYVANSIDGTICDNQVYNSQTGIYADQTSSEIYRNSISASLYGIRSTSSGIFKDNIIIGPTTGIECMRPWNIEVSNNVIRSTFTGIRIANPYRSGFIRNNTITESTIGIQPIFNFGSQDYLFIENNFIENSHNGIRGSASDTFINRNIVINATEYGIKFDNYVEDIKNNTILNCEGSALRLDDISEVTIRDNEFNGCGKGLELVNTQDNLFLNNLFINNTQQVVTTGDDKWYRPLPIGGNYWSDYPGRDRKKGNNQNEVGSDGYGDSPYIIDSTNSDIYPLIIDTVKPTADAGNDMTIDQAGYVTLDGTDSIDDNHIEEYLWTFEYDDEPQQFSYEEFDFAFHFSGEYEVDLNVSDFAGNWDKDSIIITVIDKEKPIPIIQNFSINQDETALFDGSRSIDNEGITNYTWRFIYQGKVYQLHGIQASFEFSTPGYYDIELIVLDEQENKGSKTFNLTVIDTEKPTAISNGNKKLGVPDHYTMDGSNSNDNGKIVQYEWKVTFYGDLNIYYGKIVNIDLTRYGNYSIELIVHDQFGNIDSDEFYYLIEDTEPPVINYEGILQIEYGEVLTIDASSSTDNYRIERFQWELFDKELKILKGSKMEYIFETAGFHNITLTVFDQNGLNSSKIIQILINDNQEPVANAGRDTSVNAGNTFSLDASQSTDNSRIVIYKWTFFENDIKVELFGKKVPYVFNFGGTYEIILSLKDEFDNWGSDMLLVTVLSSATVSGTLVDNEGNILSGATILITDSSGKETSTTTDENGRYELVIQFGNYSWMITKGGYGTLSGVEYIGVGENSKISSENIIIKKKEGSSGGPIGLILVIILLILVLAVGIGITLFMIRKKKNDVNDEDEEQSDAKNEQTELDEPEKKEEEKKNYYENPFRNPDAVYNDGEYIRPEKK